MTDQAEREYEVGDVFQILPSHGRNGWIGTFVQATEIKSFGIMGFVAIVTTHDEQGWAFIRLPWDQIAFVGKAALVKEPSQMTDLTPLKSALRAAVELQGKLPKGVWYREVDGWPVYSPEPSKGSLPWYASGIDDSPENPYRPYAVNFVAMEYIAAARNLPLADLLTAFEGLEKENAKMKRDLECFAAFGLRPLSASGGHAYEPRRSEPT